MSEVRNKVLDLLVNYRSNERRIALLRYEINHPPHVTADEMIEALTFSRSEVSGTSGGGISDKTIHIALNYEDRMNRLNDGALSEIAYQLYDLERQQERLLYYISLLDQTEADIIRMTYINGMINEEIAQRLGVTIRTVSAHRSRAINRLCEMFEYLSGLQSEQP